MVFGLVMVRQLGEAGTCVEEMFGVKGVLIGL